jgi:phosphosulfolactate phosphohydrolase-like enzyme
MKVYIRNSFEKSECQSELTVFIDILRASTTLLYLLKNRPKSILSFGSIEKLKGHMEQKDGKCMLFSEQFNEYFDNSPSIADNSNITGENVIHMSGNLTTSIFNNLDFKRAIIAGFVNINRVSQFITENKFHLVEIIASSHFHEKIEAVEDIACAKMLKMLLEGEITKEIPDKEKIDAKIGKRRNGIYEFPEHYWKDIELALEINTIPLLLEIVKEDSDRVRFKELTIEK